MSLEKIQTSELSYFENTESFLFTTILHCYESLITLSRLGKQNNNNNNDNCRRGKELPPLRRRRYR